MQKEQLIALIDRIVAAVDENKQYLTELDNVIGDGDHGINLARGFDAVADESATYADLEPSKILSSLGKCLMNVVGGSSGPLYGSGFKKAGVAVKGKDEVSFDDFLAMMDAAIAQIQKLGKAEEGEKTMLDAMIPAQRAMRASWEETSDATVALAAGVAAAKEGVEFTKTIVATKGRAAYLGERSLGHQDPGATSFTIILGVLADFVAEQAA